MKLIIRVCRMGSVIMLATGGLFGCSQASASKGETANQPGQVAFLKAPAEGSALFQKPKPGRTPKTKADYDDAIASVRKYRHEHASGDMVNGYISKKVVKELLANGKCEGLRMYLADSAGQGRIIVIGVDKEGMDLVTPTTVEDKTGVRSQEKYLFGISEDKCPESCVGAALYE